MREIRSSGSEGGAGLRPRSYLYLGGPGMLPEPNQLIRFPGGTSESAQGPYPLSQAPTPMMMVERIRVAMPLKIRR